MANRKITDLDSIGTLATGDLFVVTDQSQGDIAKNATIDILTNYVLALVPSSARAFGGGANQIATWAEGNNTDLIPTSKLPASSNPDLSNYVTLDGTQTITGIKNLASGTTINSQEIITAGNAQDITGKKTITAPDLTGITDVDTIRFDDGTTFETALLETTFGSGSGEVASWAEGDDTTLIPISKIPLAGGGGLNTVQTTVNTITMGGTRGNVRAAGTTNEISRITMQEGFHTYRPVEFPYYAATIPAGDDGKSITSITFPASSWVVDKTFSLATPIVVTAGQATPELLNLMWIQFNGTTIDDVAFTYDSAEEIKRLFGLNADEFAANLTITLNYTDSSTLDITGARTGFNLLGVQTLRIQNDNGTGLTDLTYVGEDATLIQLAVNNGFLASRLEYQVFITGLPLTTATTTLDEYVNNIWEVCMNQPDIYRESTYVIDPVTMEKTILDFDNSDYPLADSNVGFSISYPSGNYTFNVPIVNLGFQNAAAAVTYDLDTGDLVYPGRTAYTVLSNNTLPPYEGTFDALTLISNSSDRILIADDANLQTQVDLNTDFGYNISFTAAGSDWVFENFFQTPLPFIIARRTTKDGVDITAADALTDLTSTGLRGIGYELRTTGGPFYTGASAISRLGSVIAASYPDAIWDGVVTETPPTALTTIDTEGQNNYEISGTNSWWYSFQGTGENIADGTRWTDDWISGGASLQIIGDGAANIAAAISAGDTVRLTTATNSYYVEWVTDGIFVAPDGRVDINITTPTALIGRTEGLTAGTSVLNLSSRSPGKVSIDIDSGTTTNIDSSITVGDGFSGQEGFQSAAELLNFDPEAGLSGISTTVTVDDYNGSETTSFTVGTADPNENQLPSVLVAIEEAIDTNIETPLDCIASIAGSNVIIRPRETGSQFQGLWSVRINNNGVTGADAGNLTASTAVSSLLDSTGLDCSNVTFINVPYSNPNDSGKIYQDQNGFLKISQG